MTHYLRLFLCLVLLTVASTAHPQSAIRPYDQWESTQFVAISVRQPSDYVRADNNWDIVYTLRTPHTLKQLRDKGIPFTNSQIYLLELSGLIYADEGRWQTIIPILDKAQTDSLRRFSRVVADAIYDKTKTDFAGLTATIKQMGYEQNTFSLIFSYLLDGRMWSKLLTFEDIESYSGWAGCYYVLYNGRDGLKPGTNGYGNMDLYMTYVDSSISPDSKTIEQLRDEIARHGKVTDADLITRLQPRGVVDGQGNVLFPIIKRQDTFHQQCDQLINVLYTELMNHCGALSARFGVDDEQVALVMLYHEVMWNLIDKLMQDRMFTVPAIFQDKEAHKNRLNEVLFFTEGSLME